MPTLLCHIVWMPSYTGEGEVRAGGFDYVREEGYGGELFNFMPFDGFCYGYVRARSETINIDRLGADRGDTFVDDVTVIWTATSPQDQRVIVGWYRSARIFRNAQVGSLKGREVKGVKIGYYARARAEHNAAVEAAAIAFVRDRLGIEHRDRQKDNCGWDLEYARADRTLCVEVKGLSGSDVVVELSPNEYAAMKRAVAHEFSEGEYRLGVVCNALTTPELFLFTHLFGTDWDWVCELTSKRIQASERVAARLTESS